MKLMIVDDDLDILNLLEDILSLKFPSIELEIAKNGSEALERLQELATVNPVDIVLSDMKMPVMNGAELCKLIKETYPDIKVALMTAFNETGSCFDEIFFKPIDFDALFNFIKNNWV